MTKPKQARSSSGKPEKDSSFWVSGAVAVILLLETLGWILGMIVQNTMTSLGHPQDFD